MTEHEVSEFLRWRIGVARQHTLGQIMATLRDHGGCIIRHEDADGRSSEYRLGEPVPYNADTVIMTNHRTL